MNYRSSFFLILLAVSLLAPQFVDAQEPGKVVVATIDKGMAVLQDPALNAAEKFAERREKLWGVLRPVIQFDEMSKRALGPKWQELSVEQRAEFVDIFTFILKDAYLEIGRAHV